MFPDLSDLAPDPPFPFPPPFPFGVLLTPVLDDLVSSALDDLSLFTAFALLPDLTDLGPLGSTGVLDPFASFNTLMFDSLSAKDVAKTVSVTITIELRKNFIVN